MSPMNKSYSYDSFLYGVVYYPEQWPEAFGREILRTLPRPA